MYCRILAIFFLLAITAGPLMADVAPDPGFVGVRINLLLETDDDLSGIRFFVLSGDIVREIVVKRGEQMTVNPLGGGARYRSGTLIAVPAKSIEIPTGSGDLPADLQAKLLKNEIPGTITLLTHSFRRDVRKADEGKWKDALFKLQRVGATGVSASQVSGGNPNDSPEQPPGPFSPVVDKSPLFWVSVGVGSVLTLVFIFAGAWVFRRSRSN